MKFTLHKRTKKHILAVLILLFLFTGFQAFKAFKDEKVIIDETVTFEYSCQPSSGYQVILRPNELYDTTLDEGAYYSKLLLDYIRANFSVIYKGSEETPINVRYQVVAKVNGHQGQGANKVIYWSKDFPLTAEKVVKTFGDSWEVQEQVNFNLKEYDSFAVKAKEISGMKVTNEVIVELAGTIVAEKDGEEIEIPFSSGLLVPLLEDVFMIEKESAEPLDAAITETEKIFVPYNQTKVSLLVVTMLLLLTAMPVLMFIIKEPDEFAMLRKKNNVILKNYGSRMVAMQEVPDLKFSKSFQVSSMKDMIKIADEVQKPIIYIPDDSLILRNSEMFIIDENNLYRWNSA
ncbi:MAG TPA: DUF5305 family protein [Anaerovoracaceae bacterium]|nr:DUF5305 family protein [Anaerovoracaceae bacterium]